MPKPTPTSRRRRGLKPNSAVPHESRRQSHPLGKLDLAEAQFKKAAELDPKSYDTNHNLGEAYVRAGQLAKAEHSWPWRKRSIRPLTTTV